MQHIGELIEKEVSKSGLTPPAFAELVNMTPVGFRKIFSKSTIQAELIESISKALGKNLFKMLAENYDHDQGIKSEIHEPISGHGKSVISEGRFSLNIEIPEDKKEELLKLILDK